MSVTISSVKGERILDSRNVPTLLVTVTASSGLSGSFAVPSGASTGIHEAHELRDDGSSHGDVRIAISLIEGEIQRALIGRDVTSQKVIDDILIALDGTETKSRLGGNTLIGVSIATAKVGALSREIPLWKYLHESFFQEKTPSFPRLYANLINGGKHAKTKLVFQEYHIVPKASSLEESLQILTKFQNVLFAKIQERYGELVIGDEGGCALPVSSVTEPLGLYEEVREELVLNDRIDFALDVASTSFYDEGTKLYHVGDEDKDTAGMHALYEELLTTYHLLSIEDPFYEEDFKAFTESKRYFGASLRVGDDLTTTSVTRLKKAIEEGCVDALIIKPNQIGTLTETIATMRLADAHGIKCIVSHRSGETMDSFIADLAYASGAYGIKAGARGPKEREVKYARLLEIEEEVSRFTH
jgi:enolase